MMEKDYLRVYTCLLLFGFSSWGPQTSAHMNRLKLRLSPNTCNLLNIVTVFPTHIHYVTRRTL